MPEAGFPGTDSLSSLMNRGTRSGSRLLILTVCEGFQQPHHVLVPYSFFSLYSHRPEVAVRTSRVGLRWGLGPNPHPAIRLIQAVFLVVGGGGGGLSTKSYSCLLSLFSCACPPLLRSQIYLLVIQPPPPPPRKAF